MIRLLFCARARWVALAVLLSPWASLAQPLVYHSPLDDGTPSAFPLVIPDGGSGSLYLYLKTGGTASSDPTAVCIDADGEEICAAGLRLSTTGALQFASFVPEPTADAVWALSPSEFRINVLDTVAPVVGTHRYGALQVVAAPGSCPPDACLVTVNQAEVIEADLDVGVAQLTTPSTTIATVPEPDTALGLISGMLLLFALHLLRNRHRPHRSRRRAAAVSRRASRLVFILLAVAGGARAAIGPCGDVDVDASLTAQDLALYRAHLADPAGTPLTPAGEARCQLSHDSPGCDLLSAVILSRRLAAPLARPGIAPACAAVAPLDLQASLAAERDVRVVDAAGEELEVTAADGTVYHLTIPPGAINVSSGVIVEMRPISALNGFDGSGGYLAGVELLPEGLPLDQPGVLRVEFASPPPATRLAVLEYTGSGGAATFVPVLLDSASPVASIELPIFHFSGRAAVGVTPDELASTPPPPAIDDARRLQELAYLAEQAVNYGLLGLDFFSDPDVQGTSGRNIREWLDEITNRVYASYGSCSDLHDISRSLLAWAELDTRFGVQLKFSTDPDDLALWQTMAGNVVGTANIVASQYQAAADHCAGPSSDPCSRFLVRRDTESCYQQGAGILAVMQLPPLDPAAIDMDALCPTAPSTATFARTDTLANGPFEACPADAPFEVSAAVFDRIGNPVPIEDPFSFSSSNAAILAVTPNASGASVAPVGGLGPVVLEGEWTTCPEFTSATNVFVGIAPKLVGTWGVTGYESMTGCQDPEENYPPTYGEVSGEIEAQVTNPDASVDFNVFGPDWEGVANLQCGGLDAVFAGTDPYSFEGGYGMNSYAGVLTGLSGSPGHRTATEFEIEWISQDLVGDTCRAEGSGTLSRTD